MSYPTMTTTTVEQTATALTLDVEHHIGQSWSRSVDPKAMRAARGLLRSGGWELHDTNYGHGTREDETRSVSRYYFRKA